jgi:hypothetical protein
MMHDHVGVPLRGPEYCEKGGVIADSTPFCFLQTPASKKSAFCCTNCACFLGDLDAILGRAKGLLQRPADYISDVNSRLSQSDENDSNSNSSDNSIDHSTEQSRLQKPIKDMKDKDISRHYHNHPTENGDSSINNRNNRNAIVMCSKKGCSCGYCSEECLYLDRNTGHWLLCTGGPRDESNLTR